MPMLKVINGDCLEVLSDMPEQSAQTCITSPPYWNLRDYGHREQLGLEKTPEEYVTKMVSVFREVKRVLKNDGTLWLNLGDCFLDKNQVGIPWRVALALKEDGWWLRSDIIWHKSNPMPESVSDRPTKSHEYLFLMTKSDRYYYDADAIKEPLLRPTVKVSAGFGGNKRSGGATYSGKPYDASKLEKRNKRSVWTIPTRPFSGAHCAPMPPDLITPCILAGSKEGDCVLDPFSGAGTVGMIAARYYREYIGIEINPEFVQLSQNRIKQDAPLFR